MDRLKTFNTTGVCIPKKHYMVNMDSRLEEMEKLIAAGKYFTVNQARQFGKTTLLNLLYHRLQKKYLIINISFEAADEYFVSLAAFAKGLAMDIADTLLKEGIEDNLLKEWEIPIDSDFPFKDLGRRITRLCNEVNRGVILIVDEVDKNSDNQIFMSFLGLLRDKYLNREKGTENSFQSVILAGVYEIKNLKSKYRKDNEHKYNSPWNIAVKFDADMSFSAQDIETMLLEYKTERKKTFDNQEVSNLIYDYTSGYPFLVSRICQIMDEENIEDAWTKVGVIAAVKVLLSENNTLFDDMFKKIAEYSELSNMLKNILFTGESYAYNTYNFEMSMGSMFGFIKEQEGRVAISNRIFETRMYDYFIVDELMKNKDESYKAAVLVKNQFIENGKLNMKMVLEKFSQHFADVYAGCDMAFLEENARRFFLLYLKPIINGTGNYYVEARTRDMGRTDIVVDYKGEQFIIELKIWRGEKYQQKGREQLAEYLESYHLDKGYLLSFCFNRDKEVIVRTIECAGKTIVEAVV